jgi:hypothetical protein
MVFNSAVDRLRIACNRRKQRRELIEYLTSDHRAANDLGITMGEALVLNENMFIEKDAARRHATDAISRRDGRVPATIPEGRRRSLADIAMGARLSPDYSRYARRHRLRNHQGCDWLMFAPGFAAQISKIATPKYGPLKPDVRYWHLADIKIALPNVRFRG